MGNEFAKNNLLKIGAVYKYENNDFIYDCPLENLHKFILITLSYAKTKSKNEKAKKITSYDNLVMHTKNFINDKHLNFVSFDLTKLVNDCNSKKYTNLFSTIPFLMKIQYDISNYLYVRVKNIECLEKFHNINKVTYYEKLQELKQRRIIKKCIENYEDFILSEEIEEKSLYIKEYGDSICFSYKEITDYIKKYLNTNKCSLTQKEKIVCKSLLQNYSIKQIAMSLNVSSAAIIKAKNKIIDKLKSHFKYNKIK